ncbi:MAG: DUF86 domain-containing protein [Alphaproteobacteria bacterium]|nr:DUF86 domain-containing protein [Alphaproteobacteria bacterium]
MSLSFGTTTNKEYYFCLVDVSEAIDKIQDYLAGRNFSYYESNTMVHQAVERCFEIILKANNNIPETQKIFYPRVPWDEFKKIHQILQNGYRNIDHHLMWDFINKYLPTLRVAIDSMVDEYQARELKKLQLIN